VHEPFGDLVASARATIDAISFNTIDSNTRANLGFRGVREW
jgi:hypothetical protein